MLKMIMKGQKFLEITHKELVVIYACIHFRQAPGCRWVHRLVMVTVCISKETDSWAKHAAQHHEFNIVMIHFTCSDIHCLCALASVAQIRMCC